MFRLIRSVALFGTLICAGSCVAGGPPDYELYVLMDADDELHVNDVLEGYLQDRGFRITRASQFDDFNIERDMFLATKIAEFEVISLSVPLSGEEDTGRCGDFQGVAHPDPGQFGVRIWKYFPSNQKGLEQFHSDIRDKLREAEFTVMDEPVECSTLVKAFAPS